MNKFEEAITSVLFPLNAHNMLHTVYLSPVTSYMFRCLLHHFQGDHCVICSKLYAFCNVAIKCTIYSVFKFTMLLQCLKQYVLRPSES